MPVVKNSIAANRRKHNNIFYEMVIAHLENIFYHILDRHHLII